MKERKQLRLKDYDYSQTGYYLVTICTQNREEWFGRIEKGEMIFNPYGVMVNQCWEDLPKHYSNCSLDVFVIMPNHLHGIVVIDNNTVGNGLKPFPTRGLSEIIRGFKTFSSRKINEEIKEGNKFRWQKSFYDHIIRSEKSLENLRTYIVYNSFKWELDIENRKTVRLEKNSKDYYKEIIDGKQGPALKIVGNGFKPFPTRSEVKS